MAIEVNRPALEKACIAFNDAYKCPYPERMEAAITAYRDALPQSGIAALVDEMIATEERANAIATKDGRLWNAQTHMYAANQLRKIHELLSSTSRHGNPEDPK